jgi:putative ABC transport system ATP-binding protein
LPPEQFVGAEAMLANWVAPGNGADPSHAAASCSGVVKIYWSATGEVQALKGIDASFEKGVITALVGPSGSGKSSLLRILGCIDPPTAGQVRIGGTDVSSLSRARRRKIRREHLGYVFQRPSDNLVPYLTAEQHMVLAGRVRGSSDKNEWFELLRVLGLGDRADHSPSQLSGGEQQRLAFAAAVAGRPPLVLGDEPTAELDAQSGAVLMERVAELAQTGIAFVIATHDPVVMRAADRILHLRHGHLEAETALGDGQEERRSLAVIDGSGRVQLPPEALRMFPGRRAVITVEEDGVRVTPP